MSTQDLKGDRAAVAAAGTGPTGAAEPVAPRRSRGWVRLGKAALWTGCVILALAVVAAGFVVWTVRRSFPVHDGTLPLRGLSAPVTVHRDEYGVPHLFASSAHDLFKAQGYVHAQDRFWEMDFRRHVSFGRLAELFGPSQLPTDAFFRTLGWRDVVEREWQLISPQAKGHLQAYADGVNAWIADNAGAQASAAKSLEYAVLGFVNSGYTVEPWQPIDSLAWLKVMAWDLRGNMGAEIARSALLAEGLSREQIAQLYPAYPFARHQPIVVGGTVVNGAFDAGAAPASSPATRAVSNPDSAVAREAAALVALGRAMRALPDMPFAEEATGIGSNAWAVSGALTASGRPLLAGDPHLAPSLPGVWYQIGLHCTCEFNVAGVSLSGVPGVIIGHNDRIAWGLTNLGPDVMDLYLEKVDGERYFDGTAWRDLRTRQEVIQVAGAEPVTITVRATKHGPILSDRSAELFGVAARPPMDASGSPVPRVPGTTPPSLDPQAPGVPPQAGSVPYAVALSWTAFEPGRTVESVFALNAATGWTQFRAAAALAEVPAQSMVYADVDGNIGYQTPGRIPVRGKGDGRWPAPGWDPAYDWTGHIPFAELPHVFNPPGGVIVSANQAPIGPQYPHTIAVDWSYGYRSQRILDMIAERSASRKLTVEDMRQMQFDNEHGFAETLVPKLLEAPPGAGGDATLSKARDLLRHWDFQQQADSAAAAFYNAVWRHLLLRTFDELPEHVRPRGDDRWWEVVRPLLDAPASPWWDDRRTAETESMAGILAAAMTDAVTELRDRLGDDPSRWRWGDLHTLTLVSETFGLSGIAPIEWLFNHEPVPAAGGSGTVNATSWSADWGYEADFVPSMRMIVDLSNLDGSRWVNLSGNSGHAFHANYADQVQLWRAGQDTAMRWTRPSIESASTHVLTLEPVRG